MAVSILIVACLLCYLTSKHFPLSGERLMKMARQKPLLNILAIILAVTSLVLFYGHFNGVTAFVVWLTALMTILSAVILSVKLNVKWVYFWSVVVLLFMIVDFL